MPPLTSLSALQNALQALPPPAPGKVRIFRGQATEYKTITPAAFRNPLEFGGIWRFYSQFLQMDITNELFDGHLNVKQFRYSAYGLKPLHNTMLPVRAIST